MAVRVLCWQEKLGAREMSDKECVIWHLSDMHLEFASDNMCSPTPIKDRLMKTVRPCGIEVFLKKLHENMDASLKPNIVVITGDITQHGRLYGDTEIQKRLNDFFDTIETFVKAEHIILVPGNHDMIREDPLSRDAAAREKRLEAFNEYFKNRKNIITLTKLTDKSIPITANIKHLGKRCVHFEEYNLLFHLFDSCEKLGGVSLGLISEIKDQIDKYGLFFKSTLNKFFDKFVQKSVQEADTLDAACVPEDCDDNLGLTNETLQIALLHHHISPNLVADVKAHDMVSNAGTFIKALSKVGVKMTLHGHKHAICNSRLELIAPLETISSRFEMAVLCGGRLNVAQPPASFNIIRLNKEAKDFDLIQHTLFPVEFKDASFELIKERSTKINVDFKQRFFEAISETGISNITLFKKQIKDNANGILENMLQMNELPESAPYLTKHLVNVILREINDATKLLSAHDNGYKAYSETILKVITGLTGDAQGNRIVNTMMGCIEDYLKQSLGDYHEMALAAIQKRTAVQNLLMIPLTRYRGWTCDEEDVNAEAERIQNIHDMRERCFAGNKEYFEMKCVYLDKNGCPMITEEHFGTETLGSLDCFVVCNDDRRFHKMVVGEFKPGSPLDGPFPHLTIESGLIVDRIIRVLSNIYKDEACEIKDNGDELNNYITLGIKLGVCT